MHFCLPHIYSCLPPPYTPGGIQEGQLPALITPPATASVFKPATGTVKKVGGTRAGKAKFAKREGGGAGSVTLADMHLPAHISNLSDAERRLFVRLFLQHTHRRCTNWTQLAVSWNIAVSKAVKSHDVSLQYRDVAALKDIAQICADAQRRKISMTLAPPSSSSQLVQQSLCFKRPLSTAPSSSQQLLSISVPALPSRGQQLLQASSSTPAAPSNSGQQPPAKRPRAEYWFPHKSMCHRCAKMLGKPIYASGKHQKTCQFKESNIDKFKGDALRNWGEDYLRDHKLRKHSEEEWFPLLDG